MAMVGVDSDRRTDILRRLAWSLGQWPLGAVLHSPNELGELATALP